MDGEEATYDYDGTDFEYIMITDMLNSTRKVSSQKNRVN
jgi:hypothetical protein